jgi:2-methylcitrate dehydratase PrpD
MGPLADARSRGKTEPSRRAMVMGGLAAAAFPGSAGAAADDVSPVMRKLSAYMNEAGQRALPDVVVQQAKYHILDTLAAMVSGSELPPGRQAMQFARAFGGQPTATIVASNIMAGPLEAAIVNGALAQADETDDNYSAGGAHPGCAIVPASLALGEVFGVDGVRFLRAVTLGYDVGMRAMKSVVNDSVLRDTHNIVGTFGASAAGGCLAGLNEQQMRWLLDYASQQAGSGFGAWQRDTEHTEKAFLFGSAAARNGVTTTLVIKSGWTGVNDVFSGHENFFRVFCKSSGYFS